MPRDFDDLDDDLIDDTFPTPAPVQARMGDSEVLLRRAVDIIATAPSIPLSSTPRIDRDEIIELLEDALERLPEEIRQARWMLKERQEFLDKTKREADEIITAARQQAERMVQRTEVVRAAEMRVHDLHGHRATGLVLLAFVDTAHTTFGDKPNDPHAADITAEKRILARLGRLDPQGHREALEAGGTGGWGIAFRNWTGGLVVTHGVPPSDGQGSTDP